MAKQEDNNSLLVNRYEISGTTIGIFSLPEKEATRTGKRGRNKI